MGQDLDGSTAASHGRIYVSQQLETQSLGFGAKGFDGALAHIRSVDLAVPNQVAGQFELRLDQNDALRACAQPKGQPAQHASCGNEADVHSEEIERSGRHIQRQGFEVGALQASHTPVASQIGQKLPMSHVNRGHMASALFEQHRDEPASGRA